jgi:hypothetical protein
MIAAMATQLLMARHFLANHPPQRLLGEVLVDQGLA